MTNDTPSHDLIDGFHLVIDALKLNGIDTIFGLPGIPITDLTRMAQAEGMRVISFRHEQHAGNAAAAAGYLTQKMKEGASLAEALEAGLDDLDGFFTFVVGTENGFAVGMAPAGSRWMPWATCAASCATAAPSRGASCACRWTSPSRRRVRTPWAARAARSRS